MQGPGPGGSGLSPLHPAPGVQGKYYAKSGKIIPFVSKHLYCFPDKHAFKVEVRINVFDFLTFSAASKFSSLLTSKDKDKLSHQSSTRDDSDTHQIKLHEISFPKI